ncbi:glycerol-3-phosphate acyltransferase [Raphidocelis subcapitata]|uniref:Glycerol-3-phosphate acyltransferase n=1 Tax=Raphidocelis subcapitata TaxID=307507 RepID=A0A2V0P8T4_9CHLO|nr:glycerol-3-phosphate acyltransferase [Raphidocelis subcapitata]|eukprot:GBF93567.1 glycerol-3-phosphate acyltransferase [Raphidocelis subcapitata]
MSVTEAAPNGVARTTSAQFHSFLPGLTMPAGHAAAAADDLAELTDREVEQAYVAAEEERLLGHSHSLLTDMLSIEGVLADAAAAVVDDSFNKCFTSTPSDPWNWNLYLFPMWLLGVVFRYVILFPLRLFGLIACFAAFFLMFFPVKALWPPGRTKLAVEQRLIRFMCGGFVLSWTGVIRFHGPRPIRGAGRVWVANHTSMIDYIILSSYSAFAVIMQLHSGWVGFLQTQCLDSLGCLWFNRTEVKDRHLVAQRMRQHVHADATPLLIFPEGTCVNNEYCVMFKRGAFEMDAVVHPIAIKYNKIFVDAFWNSRRQSFTQHLLKLMTSWAVVADVYFLEPQRRREGEGTDGFASRVQEMIARKANLRVVPWDGYLKYYNLGEKHPGLIEKRRRVYADVLRKYLRPSEAGGGAGAGGARPGSGGGGRAAGVGRVEEGEEEGEQQQQQQQRPNGAASPETKKVN